jgi:hypothetical protein
MDGATIISWTGKSPEEVLARSYHEIRNPISLAAGYLNLLKSASELALSAEQVQDYTALALRYATQAQTIVDSVYRYMNEKYDNS